MMNRAAILEKRRRVTETTSVLFSLLSQTGEGTYISDEELAKTLEVSKDLIADTRITLVQLGILNIKRNSGGGHHGKSRWTFLVSEDMAGDILKQHWADEEKKTQANYEAWVDHMRQRKPKAPKAQVKRRAVPAEPNIPLTKDETVHSSGPEPLQPMKQLAEARKDESYALITAARQYHDRVKAIEDAVKLVTEAGVDVNRSFLYEAFKLPVDSRLETIGLVLPFIDQLERTNERLQQALDPLRRKSQRIDELERRNKKLEDMLNARVSASVGQSHKAMAAD